MKRRSVRTAFSVLIVAVMLICTALPAMADTLDPTASCSLTVKSEISEGTISGVSFSIYRVADILDASLSIRIVEPFDSYPIDVENITLENVDELAYTLMCYVKSDGVLPAASGSTGADGSVTFAPLTQGLYLVIGENNRVGDYSYEPSQFLIALPMKHQGSNDWVYDVTSTPKYNFTKVMSPIIPDDDDEKTEIRVLKRWDDDEIVTRPDSIMVNLFCDGALYERAELSEATSWRHVFEDLEKGHEWVVTEDVPENYTVTMEQDGTAIRITNKLIPPLEPPTDGDNPTPPDDDNPVPPDDDGPITPGDNPPAEENPLSPPPERLPQLGVVIWPIPVLALAGVLFVFIGIVLRKFTKNER